MVRFYEELGNLFFKVNDFSKSEQAYNNGLDINPNDVSILNSYSRSLAKKVQRLDEAKQMIKLCNELEPNKGIYQDTYAWVLYKQGKYNEANDWLNRSVTNGGNKHAIVWEHKGDISYKLGDKDQALMHWQADSISEPLSEESIRWSNHHNSNDHSQYQRNDTF